MTTTSHVGELMLQMMVRASPKWQEELLELHISTYGTSMGYRRR
ncbi:hypothetical protein ACXVUM_00235 [Williamsia sp. SKLECPSW1]